MAILGSDRNNINIDGADTSFIDFGGNDTYTIIPSLFADVTITDNQASRIILPAGMDVSAANFSSNGVQFVVNGFTVTFIGNPALFSFVFGGTPIDPSVGTAKTFAQTAAAFGTTVPAPGAGTNAATQTGPIGLAGNVGQGPVLTTSASSVNEGGSVTLSISGAAANSVFDYTITGIEASDISLPLTGVFTTDADGAFTTPLSAFVDNEVEGTEVAVLTLDGTGRSVQLAISDANTTNQPPAVVSPVAIFGDEDTLLIGRIDATDVDGDTLTYSLTSLASSGTAAVDPTGGLTYNPNANFNGSDSFVVTINDGKGGVVTQTVNVTVVPVNDTPTVIPTLSLLGTSATTLSGEVGATDIDGDVLSYTVSNPAENGAVTVNDEGEIAYTPNADFTGGDTFEITVSDGNGGVVTQVVDVTVLPDSRTEGDIIDGRDGDDELVGGNGDDELFGGDGTDRLFGLGGDDLLFGGAGDDDLVGGLGNDELVGGDDRDDLFGGDGTDRLIGAGGDDLLFGGAGDDELVGGLGNDELVGGIGNDKLAGSNGNDRLFGEDGDDVLFGEDGEDELIGGNGNDELVGGNGTDQLFGEDGEDLLFGGAGDDGLRGGNGNDNLFGGAGNDNLFGGEDDDVLVGGGGNDIFRGGAGSDRLFGGTENDRLFGEDGDDFLSGEDGDDTLLGGEGNDALFGGAGNDILDGGGGDNRLFGESGADIFIMSFGSGITDVFDMNMSNEVLVVDAKFGFNSPEEVFDTLSRPFENVSEFVLSETASIRIFDDFSTGERIGINNIRIEVLDMSVA